MKILTTNQHYILTVSYYLLYLINVHLKYIQLQIITIDKNKKGKHDQSERYQRIRVLY